MAHKAELKDTVQSYLTRLNVPFVYTAFDQTRYDQCIENMVERGWSESTQAAARIFLLPSLAISLTAYAHRSEAIQVFIAIYTTLMIYFDDITVKGNLDSLKAFGKVLLEERSHGHEVLDASADILREIPKHYGDLAGSIILSATLRYISSVVIEQEMSQVSVSACLLDT